MTPDEQLRLDRVESLLGALIKSDRYLLAKTLQIIDGRDVQLGTSAGTKIGTAAKQKLGFFGTPPITQPVSPTFPSGGVIVDTQARASINQIINTLSENSGGLGLTA